MDEYIKRNELAEMIEKNVNLPYGEGYTGKDHELVDWCKGECIRMAHCLPFACDVVPIVGHNDPIGEPGEDGLESSIRYAKAEVARGIFEEIRSCCIQRKWDGLNIVSFEIDAIKYAELKKKYTEGET